MNREIIIQINLNIIMCKNKQKVLLMHYRVLVWYLSGGHVSVLLGQVESLFHRLPKKRNFVSHPSSSTPHHACEEAVCEKHCDIIFWEMHIYYCKSEL